MSENKFTFPVGYHDFHNVNEREIGNGPHFTKDEQAQHHCQIGNIGLVLDVMANWIAEKNRICYNI